MSLINEVHYDDRTPEEVIRVLENLYDTGKRVCIYYGDPDSGFWSRRIGRSASKVCGQITLQQPWGIKDYKIPTLAKNATSKNGQSILDFKIVKMTSGNRILYSHPNFHEDVSDQIHL